MKGLKSSTIQGLFWCIPVAIFTLIAALFWGREFVFQDLTIYWQVTRQILLSGNEVYKSPDPSLFFGSIGLLEGVPELTVWSPPYFILPMLPFSLLSLEGAKVGFLFLLLFTAITSATELFRLQKRSYLNPRNWLFVVCCFPWYVWVDGALWGGLGIFAAFGVWLLSRLDENTPVLYWMIALFFFVLKPHSSAVFLTMFFLLGDQKVRKKLLRSSVGILFLLLWIPLLFPTAVREYLEFDLSLPQRIQPYTSTFFGLLSHLGLKGWLPYLFILPAGLGLLFYVWSKREDFGLIFSPLESALLLSPVAVSLSPYAWNHDYALCSGWFTVAALAYQKEREKTPVGFFLPVFFLNALSLTPLRGSTTLSVLGASAWALTSLWLAISVIRRKSPASLYREAGSEGRF